MSNDQIKQRLAELHADLERTDDVDAELHRLLGEVDRDIHELLARDAADAAEADDLAGRVNEMAADFAAQYPTAARYLREVAEMLSKLGI